MRADRLKKVYYLLEQRFIKRAKLLIRNSFAQIELYDLLSEAVLGLKQVKNKKKYLNKTWNLDYLFGAGARCMKDYVKYEEMHAKQEIATDPSKLYVDF